MPAPPPGGGILDDAYGSCWGPSGDGQKIFGLFWTAAVWRWDGTQWGPTEFLGVLPGTSPNVGRATVRGISADGSVMVGDNTYAGDP